MLFDEAVKAIAAGADLALAFNQPVAVSLGLPPRPFRPDLLQRWKLDDG